MIPRNAEPTSHRTPRPRIDLNPVRTGPANVAGEVFSYSPTEADRIWRITRQVAEGTCAPSTPDVDTSGWEAA